MPSFATVAQPAAARPASSARKSAQPQLRMGRPGDVHEREADHLADALFDASLGPTIQPTGTRAATQHVQRSAGADAASSTAAPPAVHQGLRSPSLPLADSARRFMAARLGHDFSEVRVHADERAASAARAIGARAYTVGADVVFGAGQYQPASRAGLQLIAHELAHVLQQRGREPLVSRAMLYPAATVTKADDDPIQRYLSGDNSLALTTLTLNGSEEITAARLGSVFFPTDIEAKPAAPVAPTGQRPAGAEGSGSGSGSGAGSASPVASCGLKNFDVRVSANQWLPKAPSGGRWGPNLVERASIRRRGLPGACASTDRISVVMKGSPDSTALRQWIIANEDEHVQDMQAAARRFLAPEHARILALRGTGPDAAACTANLRRQLDEIPGTNVEAFLQTVRSDVLRRDAPGGHKFDVTFQPRNGCDNLEMMVSKTPAPPASRR